MDASNTDRIWTLATRKMSGEATLPELDELESYLKLHPELQSTVQAVEEFWRTNPEPDREYMEATYLLHLQRMKNRGFDFNSPEAQQPSATSLGSRIREILFGPTSIVAALILVFAISILTNQRPVKPVSANLQEAAFKSEVSTKYGSRTRIVLPDGSIVFLNAGSKLNYDKNFGNSIREVKLTGEGFFDVAPNPDKPFKIYTDAVEIKVIGTQFNVKSYPGEKTTETSIIRGTVQVTVKERPNEKYVLKPNEKLVVMNNGSSADSTHPTLTHHEPMVSIRKLSYMQGEQTAVETSWTQNKLSFQDETFVEISSKMQRWYDVTFEFRNPRQETARFTGSFKDESLQQALEAMKYTSAFHFEIRNKVVTIY